MSTTGIILLSIYIIGVPIWMFIEKKYIPYQEGEYTIEFDRAYEVTPEMHKTDAIARSVMWPLCAAFVIVLLPVVLLEALYEKIG